MPDVRRSIALKFRSATEDLVGHRVALDAVGLKKPEKFFHFDFFEHLWLEVEW